MKPISFELDGAAEILRSENACRRAVKEGQIVASTLVTTANDSGERYQIAAVEHPLLGTMLKVERPLPELEVPAANEPPPVPEAETASTEDSVTEPEVSIEAEPVSTPEAQPEAGSELVHTDPLPAILIPPAGSSNSLRALGWIMGAVLLFALIKSCASGESGTKSAEPAATDAVTAAKVDPDAGKPLLNLYLTRRSKVRGAPDGTATPIGWVERGEMVSGVEVPSQSDARYSWLKIKDGQFAGSYVTMLNLSSDTRPTLDTSQAGDWYVVDGLTPLEDPKDAAVAKRGSEWLLAAGQMVAVAGTVEGGVFSSAWAEVMLENTTGVGYVPIDRLSRDAPYDAAAAAADAAIATGQSFLINNTCNKAVVFLFRFEDASGEHVIDAPLPAATKLYLGYNGDLAQLVSPVVHYAFMTIGGRRARDESADMYEYFNGRRYNMRRLQLTTQADGTYGETFKCD